MNDLRSRSRALSAVPDEGAAPTSTPPRIRPDTEGGRRMSRRQSIVDRAKQLDPTAEAADVAEVADGESGIEPAAADDHKFRSSRPRTERAVETAGAEADGAEEPIADRSIKRRPTDEDDEAGPSSRPNRRRDVADEEVDDEDKFPWHFQFDDDEPAELQASSPLLSRAFRATTG